MKSVSVSGDVHRLLFYMRIKQEYVNETTEPLEIIYTFPLVFGTTLLGMEARIDEKTLQAAIIEKQQAEDKYEEALEAGDSAIMLQKSASGLYTANLAISSQAKRWKWSCIAPGCWLLSKGAYA